MLAENMKKVDELLDRIKEREHYISSRTKLVTISNTMSIPVQHVTDSVDDPSYLCIASHPVSSNNQGSCDISDCHLPHSLNTDVKLDCRDESSRRNSLPVPRKSSMKGSPCNKSAQRSKRRVRFGPEPSTADSDGTTSCPSYVKQLAKSFSRMFRPSESGRQISSTI